MDRTDRNGGTVTVRDIRRVVLDGEAPAWLEWFVRLWKAAFGTVVDLSQDEQRQAGDLCLRRLPEGNPSRPEWFSVTAADGMVKLTAETPCGWLRGCCWLIRTGLGCDGGIPAMESAPEQGERGLCLDCGRKFYRPEWICRLIHVMAFSGLNTLMLHFSEDMGLRLESRRYPWLAGSAAMLCPLSKPDEPVTDPDEGAYLTLSDMEHIVREAERFGVEVIPSFDSPGHMNYLVYRYNSRPADFSFTYGGRTYRKDDPRWADIGNHYHSGGKTALVAGSGNPRFARGIDITNEAAVAFVRSVMEEYADFFRSLGCTKWDMGGDELLGFGASLDSQRPKWTQLDHWQAQAQAVTGDPRATAYDDFLLYMNETAAFLRAHGFSTVRMWNDCAALPYASGAVRLDPSIEIQFWTENTSDIDGKPVTAADFAAAGHAVYNCLSAYGYFVLKPDAVYPGVKVESILKDWHPGVFHYAAPGTDTALCALPGGAVSGSAFCIWSDRPDLMDEEEVLCRAAPLMAAHGMKAWASDVLNGDPIAGADSPAERLARRVAEVESAAAFAVAHG